MAGYKDITPQKEFQFKTGQSGNPSGRPKKIYTILKEKGFGRDDILACFKEIAFYNKKELDELLKREDVPVITLVVARAFVKAVSKGQWSFVKEIMEQVIGKSVQNTNVDITTNGNDVGKINYDKLTLDELLTLKKLNEKARDDK
jgi:hypothetical protein|tara:strand:+ start:805 stop:1239 length:435 start_codon:yes stop_codon:yes gene_type:complete